MNRWNIPPWLEQEVLARDARCVYCGTEFAGPAGPRGQQASWEHIVNDARIVTRANIARCCVSCNASKGALDLAVWLDSAYCQRQGIRPDRVAPVVREALSVRPSMPCAPGQAEPSVPTPAPRAPASQTVWVVIFRAQVRQLDDEYRAMAARLRELALTEFGCLEFHAISEGGQEVALSYWPNPAAVRAWRLHPEHQVAQRLGRERWYRSHRVEVARVERAYTSALV